MSEGRPGSERRIDARVRALIESSRHSGFLVEFLVFGLKQAWACLFGALLLAALMAAALWYPDQAVLARNDFLVLTALAIQVVMLALRLETAREAAIILVFHIVGTGMELFKTAVGSWEYAAGGILHIGAVPLFTGFMYAAVGSYLARVMRMFDLRFRHYPRLWATGVLALAIYLNFFTHHWIWDFRWPLVAAVLALFIRTTMYFRVQRVTGKMPVALAFMLVALFIWIAENLGTAAGAWSYPNQHDGWHLVSISKLGSWFLLIQISVFLVTLVNRPQRFRDGAA